MNPFGVVTIKLDRGIDSKVNAKLDSAPKPRNFFNVRRWFLVTFLSVHKRLIPLCLPRVNGKTQMFLGLFYR